MIPHFYHIKIKNGLIDSICRIEECSIVETEHSKNIYNGCKILPSFVDSHCHFHGLGLILNGLMLNKCRSAEECAALAYTCPDYRDDWIFGIGWNQSLWNNKSYPNKRLLDKLFPDTPVFLKRIDAHTAWLNSRALNILNITSASSSPKGGEIQKDENGDPTGILIDEAMFHAESHIPQFTYEQLRSQVIRSQQELAKVGVTEVHDMDLEPDFFPMFQKMEQNSELYIKSKTYFRAQNEEYLDFNLDTSGNKYFNIVGVKFFLDGALGSHGAALFDNYKDYDSNGFLILEEDQLYTKVIQAAKLGLNIATHAIGDKAVSTALKVYNKLAPKFPTQHFRVEHVQLITKQDINLFKFDNIIPSLQPVHYYSDLDTILYERLEQNQLSNAYLWKTYFDKNLNVIAGSDFPIESYDPQSGMIAFTNRTTSKGKCLLPQEEINLDSAIEAYTINPRKLFGEEVLICGANADFIVIDDRESSKDQLFQIMATYNSGKLIFSA